MKKLKMTCVLVVLVLSMTRPIYGGLVEFTFGGKVTEKQNWGDRFPPPWDKVNVGDSWSIKYCFDPATPPDYVQDGRANYDQPIKEYVLTIGDVIIQSSSPSSNMIAVFDNLPPEWDQYEVYISWPDGPNWMMWMMQLDGPSTIWHSLTLPFCGDIDLHMFTVCDFRLDFHAPTELGWISGSVDYHTCMGNQPPPPPATIRGTVYDDATNQPLADANVDATGGKQTQTNANGQYEITGFSPGSITVAASKTNYGECLKTVDNAAGGEVYTLDLPLVPDVKCDFTPSENGFPFPNTSTIGLCTGFTYTALKYYLLGVEPPPDDWWIWLEIIKNFLIFNGLNLSDIAIVNSYSPGGGPWVEPQIEHIRGSLSLNLPCPLMLLPTDLGPGTQHSVLAYKLTESWQKDQTLYTIYVYDSSDPPVYSGIILVYHQNDDWRMVSYGSYTRFGAKPFTETLGVLATLGATGNWPVVCFILSCPASLRVVGPDGLVIDQEHAEIEGGYYGVVDVYGDGNQEDVAFVLTPKPGTYTVEVIPDPGADPDGTYSLVSIRGGIPTVLADNVKISDIPDQPYQIIAEYAPIANAGPDQTVYAGMDDMTGVMLNGSGSSDADGDTLTYEWTWTIGAQTYEAHGVSPTIELPVVVHTIQLIVNDGIADSGPDQVVIIVKAPEAQPVDSLVSVAVGRAALDAKTGQFSVSVTVTNKSTTVIGSPVWLVIESISNPGVTAAQTSGTTVDGKPYIDLSGLLSNGALDPAEVVSKRIYFNNPKRVSFTFTSSVRGVILP